MKKYLFLFFLLVNTVITHAQPPATPPADTAYHVELKNVKVTAKWLNDTDRYHYNQMRFYVTTILPYLNAATKLFNDLEAKTNDPSLTRKERRTYINDREEEMRTQFDDKIKDLNVTQGVLLVKLIARQTNANIYQLLTEFKNPFVAIKWQAWARLHGINLDKKYDPSYEPDLESIMEDLGYPLPNSYAINNIKP